MRNSVIMSCPIKQYMKNQRGFFEEERELKFLWCVSDEYDELPEQKPDRDCDDWENGSLTESIIASIEEENALGLKFDNKKFDKSVPFSCFSTKTEQETMKEVQEKPNSIKNCPLAATYNYHKVAKYCQKYSIFTRFFSFVEKQPNFVKNNKMFSNIYRKYIKN